MKQLISRLSQDWSQFSTDYNLNQIPDHILYSMNSKLGNCRNGAVTSTVSSSLRNFFLPLDLQNQHIQSLLKLMSTKLRNLETINKISYILQELLQFQYFRQLKAKLTQSDYSMVIERLGLEYKPADSIIIEKDRRNDYFYIVLWGEVQLLDEVWEEGQQQPKEKVLKVINTLSKGDTFGQNSLTSFKRESTARVQAKSNCLLLYLGFDVFHRTILKLTLLRKQQITNILMNSSLFLGVNHDSVRDLAMEVYQLKFGLNQIIYSQGSKHDSLYFIKQGIVEILKQDVKLVTLSDGQSFGVQNKQLAEEKRSQKAVSKSSDLVLYKVPYNRLRIPLQNSYNLFMKNLARDFEVKSNVHKQLMKNHRKLQRMMTNISVCHNKSVKHKKIRNAKAPLKPLWWGTLRDKNIIRRPTVVEAQKQNSRSGLLGSKRISLLRLSVASKYQEEPQQQDMSFSCAVIGSLPSTLQKKVVKKNISSSDAEVLKRIVIPKLKKQKLVKYAKSGVDACEKIFFIGYD